MDPENLDVVLGLLRPGGKLFFATDHEEYGVAASELLLSHPALSVEVLAGPWSEGPRTNYEIKYGLEGRPIQRLVATLVSHPAP